MSGTKRKPVKRPQRPKITPLAITTFRAMHALECTCPQPLDRQCSGCLEWDRLDRVLYAEMRLRPWQQIAWPDSGIASMDARALYRELEAAARGEPSPWAKRAATIGKLERGQPDDSPV